MKARSVLSGVELWALSGFAIDPNHLCCTMAYKALRTHNQIFAGYVCCGPCYIASKRTKLREKYGLKGSKASDCLISCCCAQCSICQLAIFMGKEAGVQVPLTSVGK